MTGRRRRTLAVVLAACCTVGWSLDRHAAVRAANELYAAGDYVAAESALNQALVDQPDSALIRFNLGDATYRQGRYEDAAGLFDHVLATSAQGDVRRARAAYNKGNAKYRLGQDVEATSPQEALSLWADALVAYRQAMGADPADIDAKFNYELVQRKIEELQERMEQEQQEPQDQDQEQDQEQEQEQEQEEEQEQQQEQEQEQDQEQEQEQEQQQQDAQQQQQPEQQAQDQPGEQAPEESPEDLSQREAQALLDSLRDEEVDPAEINERLQGGVVAEPARDW